MPLDETAVIAGRHTVPDFVMKRVKESLPEGQRINPKYLAESYDPNIYLLKPSTVEVTFVHEGASFKNTLGYFTYGFDDQGKLRILSRGLVFPNVSYDPEAPEAKAATDPSLREGGGKLFRGDYTFLSDKAGKKIVFPAETRIGFFLVPDGWKGTTVDQWNEATPNLPYEDAERNSEIRTLGVVTTIDTLNPERVRENSQHEDLARHFVIFKVKNESKPFLDGEDFLMVCLEDILRPQGDQDFNDCIFIIRGKGIDIDGPYPGNGDDADCISISYPENTDGIICFDDTYPGAYDPNRDSDMNDFVAFYRLTEHTCPRDIRKIMGTFHFTHRGAWYDHDFGIHIPFVSTLPGKVKIEYFLSNGQHERYEYNLSEAQNNRITIFQGTRRFLPTLGDTEGFTNTRPQDPPVNPCSARFVIIFDRPIKRSEIDGMSMPYDPYLLVYTEGNSDGMRWNYDLHLNGKSRFRDAPAGLPEEKGVASFRRPADGMPYCFITHRSFPIVVEREYFAEAYPNFRSWQPPFTPETAKTVWMWERKSSKLLQSQIMKLERPWTIRI